MKFGIVSDEIDRDFAAAVRIGKAVGIERYEIRALKSGRAPMCDAAELREVERIVAGEGVTITALSPGLFKMTDDEAGFRYAMDQIYPKAAELALRWGLPGLIVFGLHKPGATEENFRSLKPAPVPRQVVDWFAEASARTLVDGLSLMVEPEPICWIDTSTAAAQLGLRINYDPGNVAWLLQRDPIDEFDVAAPWISNVHVKDWRPSQFVPAGQGLINYHAHFAALRASGYKGPISLEPHIDGSLETIRACKQAVERSYGGAVYTDGRETG